MGCVKSCMSAEEDGVKRFSVRKSLSVLLSSKMRLEMEAPLRPFCGVHYKLIKTENLDDYLAEIGVNFFKRKFAVKMLPTNFQLNYYSGVYVLKTYSHLLHVETKFKLGEEVDVKTPDGRKCKVIFTYIPPNKLLEVQKCPVVNQVERVFTPQTMETILTVNACVCKMLFLRAEKRRRFF
ncbi:fatty acid-binding protein, muscle-like isoform X2 [Cimex lectularius]|uniref:Lipocalin/cytosolic fatty-acid binding domain-containing protein n=1 Tax=Cimex lectularius TaxID=79782 RepID=A0A8I6RUL1_CIMLE|nr:fatty acid-binding protein, muscle-like isoform X2 [Cimex lectularius]XP_014248329.1 fatty acid-binding protein, muscle-like isoform X2 [Cimex lectularius]